MSVNKLGEGTKRLLRQVEMTNAALVGLTLIGIGLAAGLSPLFYGALVGGLIGLANWRAIAWLATRLANAPKRSMGFYALLAVVKMTVLFGIITVVAYALPVSHLGLLLGLSSLVVAIFLCTLLRQIEPTEAEGSAG
jgi:hypothetical protein